MKPILFILFLAVAVGCKKESSTQVETITAKLGESFELHAGESVCLNNEQFCFRFDSLLYEGRCPRGLECFWEGYALISISYTNRHDTLNTYIFFTDTVEGVYIVELQKLSPYPIYGQPVVKKNYIAQFIVNKI